MTKQKTVLTLSNYPKIKIDNKYIYIYMQYTFKKKRLNIYGINFEKKEEN